MKLSMSMFESRLSKYHEESVIHDENRTIHGLRLLSELRSEFSRDYIHLGRASDYLEDPRYADALVLANGKSHIICRGPSVEDLINEVLEVFDFFNDIERRLAEMRADSKPLDEIVALIEEITDDPYLVFSMDGEFLAACNLENLAESRIRKDIASGGRLGAASMGSYFFDEHGNTQHDLSNSPLITRNEKGVMGVHMYIRQEDERVGFVMCFPNSRSGANLALSIEPVFAEAFANSSEFAQAFSPLQSQRLTLAALALGEDAAQEACARLASAVEEQTPYALAVVKSLSIQNRTQRMVLAAEIAPPQSPCVATEVDDAVILFTSQSFLEAIIEKLRTQVGDKILSVGVSMPIPDLQAMSSAYRQALFACEVDDSPGIRFCQDLALRFLLSALKKDPAVHDMLHPSLRLLKAYDAKNATELLQTLEAYVENGCNQVTTAKQLFVHLNTLKNRMKRITEITGLNFKDFDQLFFVMLSLRLDD